MSRKFSITTVDLSKIDDEIEAYVSMNGNFDPYIFMSENTAKAIENEIEVEVRSVDLPKPKGYATYSGYKVFCNNDLKFGIVEIR